MTNKLVVRGLTAGYGDVTAVWDLDLVVSPGRVVALLGRNGAGKTTTLHAIAGLLPATKGRIELGGVELTQMPPYGRVGYGLGLVQEGKQIFRRLTVEENMMLGTYARRRCRHRVTQEELEQQYERFPMLAERRKSRAGSLSGGQQQMLAIAQALLARPSVLMLDEPSAGLAPTVVAEVFNSVRRLREEGIGILLVEQLADRALEVADEVLVLDIGRLILRYDTSEGRDAQVLEAAYFGRR